MQSSASTRSSFSGLLAHHQRDPGCESPARRRTTATLLSPGLHAARREVSVTSRCHSVPVPAQDPHRPHMHPMCPHAFVPHSALLLQALGATCATRPRMLTETRGGDTARAASGGASASISMGRPGGEHAARVPLSRIGPRVSPAACGSLSARAGGGRRYRGPRVRDGAFTLTVE